MVWVTERKLAMKDYCSWPAACCWDYWLRRREYTYRGWNVVTWIHLVTRAGRSYDAVTLHYQLLEYAVNNKDMLAGFRGHWPWKWTKLTEVWPITMAINITVRGMFMKESIECREGGWVLVKLHSYIATCLPSKSARSFTSMCTKKKEITTYY